MDLPTLGYYRTHNNVIPPKMSTAGAACYDLSAQLVTEDDDGRVTGYRDVMIFTPENETYVEPQPAKFTPLNKEGSHLSGSQSHQDIEQSSLLVSFLTFQKVIL